MKNANGDRPDEVFTFDDLVSRYEGYTARIHAECTLATVMVGGQPADPEALKAFARHYLKIDDEAKIDQAVSRILKEEIGERDTRPEEGELEEEEIYGVNMIRQSPGIGPWLGNWMVKANLKNAASRLSIFKQKIGTKGNLAEAGRLRATGMSLLEPEHPERIFLVDASGRPAETFYEKFLGHVNTPQGATNIVHHSECVAEGTRFEFEFNFLMGELTNDDWKDILALAMIVGLGSVKARERGKYKFDRVELYQAAVDRRASAKRIGKHMKTPAPATAEELVGQK